jgi:transposase
VNTIQYIALDVDDKGFSVSIRSGENNLDEISFRTRPTAGEFIKKLSHYCKAPITNIRICYEASYLGYSLQRELTQRGYHCDVIAPSLIPRSNSDKVKTDKLDARKLSLMYSRGMLTAVHIPTMEEEAIRSLVRSRIFLKNQLKSLKLHILSQIRLLGLSYRQDTDNPEGNYWTKIHLEWLKKKVNAITNTYQATNLSLLIYELESLENKIVLYEEKITEASNCEEYKDKVKSLLCYRSISTLSAMAFITELGDIRRFKSPKQITSYAGLDIKEYSSGGKERKYSITKTGNKYIRTTAIECSQLVLRPPIISRDLKVRRQGAREDQIHIADKCMQRLYKKASKLSFRGKIKNKIKVACARELLGFIWESLMLEVNNNLTTTDRSLKNIDKHKFISA